MKRSLQVSLYSMCLCLLLVSGYLLIRPISVLADSCSAQCTGGPVSVSGIWCYCRDYSGCSYMTQQGGSYMYQKNCK